MAMQTNLSKKDKMTIAVLLFAALIFMFVWYLIKPTISSIITTEDKIENAELKQTEYRNKIMYLSSGEDLYAKAVDDLNTSTSDFYEIMDSSEIDRMVTSYTLKSGLFAENLTISMPSEAVDEKPYVYSSISNKKTNNSSLSSETGNSGSADTLVIPYNTARNSCKTTKPSGVQCVKLTLVVTGKSSVCQAFLDDISSKPAVRVTGFDWSEVDPVDVYNEELGRYEKKSSGEVRLRVSFNLYMADVADYDVLVSE